MTRYDEASKIYSEIGVSTENAINTLKEIPISLHCWQGDDVTGFLNKDALSGGIQVTGNYMGKANGFNELIDDIDFAFSLIPGKKRLNLHSIYAVTDGRTELDKLEIKHFMPWLNWAQNKDIKLDFNPTLFSHPMVRDGLTLSSPFKGVRDFWVEHVKACRKIAAEIGKIQKSPCLNNIWIPDGFKDIPSDRLTPRLRLKDSLDRIFEEKYSSDYLIDSLESKVFGIGVESYTVGSSEFYMNYAAKNNCCCLLDNGHYHPTETVSDKIPSMLAFYDKVALHLTRGVRWDSDHVVLLEDELKEIAKEIIRNKAEGKVLIGLDFFDASINRIGAWVVGDRSVHKALLYALLMPHERLKELQDSGQFGELMYTNERLKTYPFGDVWKEYLKRCDVPEEWYSEVRNYEKNILAKR